MIEKSEKEVQKTQVIKKTHKGEVPVEDEDLSILEVHQQPGSILHTWTSSYLH